jgi:hypothetical protein
MSKRIYIAGPMSGYPEWNYPSFFAAEDKLRAEGWVVHNPAAKDKENGFEDAEAMVAGDTALAIKKGTFDFREAYMWDIRMVIEGDGIFMLKNWEQSPGARGEHAAAVAMKKHYPEYQIIYES